MGEYLYDGRRPSRGAPLCFKCRTYLPLAVEGHVRRERGEGGGSSERTEKRRVEETLISEISQVIVDPPRERCTGFLSQIGTKLRDWAIGQAWGSCFSWAALSSNDSKTLYVCAGAIERRGRSRPGSSSRPRPNPTPRSPPRRTRPRPRSPGPTSLSTRQALR